MVAGNFAANILQRSYVHGPSSDEPIVWYEGAGLSDKLFLHTDQRGSIIAISDASGSVTNINSYDDYGIPASTNLGRFGYTGQTWLPNLGMYYYKARIYSPTLGRFMQTDPISYGDGPNLYNYVGSDPVNSTDPSGLTGCGADLCGTFPSRPPPPSRPPSRGFGPGGGFGGGNDGGFGSYTNDRAEEFYNEQDNRQRSSCEAAGGTYSGMFPESDCIVPQNTNSCNDTGGASDLLRRAGGVLSDVGAVARIGGLGLAVVAPPAGAAVATGGLLATVAGEGLTATANIIDGDVGA